MIAHARLKLSSLVYERNDLRIHDISFFSMAEWSLLNYIKFLAIGNKLSEATDTKNQLTIDFCPENTS